MSSPWIAYVGPFMFPWGQPGSRRVYGIARTLVSCGYNVIVGSGQSGRAGQFSIQECSNITYCNTGDNPSKSKGIFHKIIQYFFMSGSSTVKWLDSMESRPDYVFVYGAGAAYMQRLRSWCNKNNIPLVVDVVEWYDGSHMVGGRFGPFNINAKIAMHNYYVKCDGVVAISRFLVDHFILKSNAQIIRIPPTIDPLLFKFNLAAQGSRDMPLVIIYAGTPGKKDLLADIIKAVAIVDEEGLSIRLKVIGPSLEDVKLLLNDAKIPRSIDVLGRLAQSEVGAHLREADFSVVLRKNLRFANAGFPTKFVESMACGTPVIANITSDIGLYIDDGIDGFVVPDCSAKSLSDIFVKIISRGRTNAQAMRIAARARAINSFSYEKYAEEMSRFLITLAR